MPSNEEADTGLVQCPEYNCESRFEDEDGLLWHLRDEHGYGFHRAFDRIQDGEIYV